MAKVYTIRFSCYLHTNDSTLIFIKDSYCSRIGSWQSSHTLTMPHFFIIFDQQSIQYANNKIKLG